MNPTAGQDRPSLAATRPSHVPGTRATVALDQLFDEHRVAVYHQALRYTGGDHGWAEDVVQETFLRAWRHLERMSAGHRDVLEAVYLREDTVAEAAQQLGVPTGTVKSRTFSGLRQLREVIMNCAPST